jgi:DNA-binding CsgD family transcriptional regulator
VNAYHTLSLVSRLKGDMQTALTAARLSYDFADESSYATPYITYESQLSLRQKAAYPAMGSSIDWAGNYLLELNGGPIQGEKLWHVPAAVQLAIVSGDLKDSSNILDDLLSGTIKVGFNQQVIETQILRALLFYEQGKTDKALLALANALEFAQYESYTRIFLDEGEPMLELLKEAQDKRIVPAYTGKLLAAFSREEERPEKKQQPGSRCPLSAREMDVLRELASGLTPRQIAERLFISIGTTRCHLHNIYEKLGAVNQVQAVRIAREQKWI